MNIQVGSDQAAQRMDCPYCQRSLLVPVQSIDPDISDELSDSKSQANAEIEAPDGSADSPVPPIEDLAEYSFTDTGKVDLNAGLSVPGESKPDSDHGNRPIGVDPMEVDSDTPIKIDGVADFYSNADVYGVTCNICDTRIHVRPDQANTEVKCPVCFSGVFVTPPEKSQRPTQRWVRNGQGKDLITNAGDDELKLSDPVARPKFEYDIDESYGLEPPTEDLLAPKRKGNDSETSELNSVADPAESAHARAGASTSKQPPRDGPPKSLKTRRERYEEAQRRQQSAESRTTYRPEPLDENQFESKHDFPGFDFFSLLAASFEMLRSPGVFTRTSLAIALMSFGTIAMQWFAEPAVKDDQGAMIQGLVLMAQWGIFGLVPYLLGVIILWFTAGYLFRDAALGNRQVESWKNAGTSEVTSTFLLFSFGFFIGGLPAALFTLMTLPLRILFSPLLLLGAWYSQAPFSIVNVDAFQNFSKDVPQWKSFYLFLAGLAFLAFFAGLMFWIRSLIPGPLFVLSMLLSFVAVLIVAIVTLVFAAVCGWHCGRVAESLEN